MTYCGPRQIKLYDFASTSYCSELLFVLLSDASVRNTLHFVEVLILKCHVIGRSKIGTRTQPYLRFNKNQIRGIATVHELLIAIRMVDLILSLENQLSVALGWPEWALRIIIVLSVLVCLTSIFQAMVVPTESSPEKGITAPKAMTFEFRLFQLQYLGVYLTIMLADWLQGTNMYTLYSVRPYDIQPPHSSSTLPHCSSLCTSLMEST